MLYHDVILFLHLIGLAAGLGVGVANIFIVRWAGESESPETATILRSLPPRLSQISTVGLVVLVVTGLLLLIDVAFGAYPWNQFWFWLKLLGSGAMVAIAVLVFQAQGQIRRGETPRFAQYMPMIGPSMGALGLLVVLFSTFAFH